MVELLTPSDKIRRQLARLLAGPFTECGLQKLDRLLYDHYGPVPAPTPYTLNFWQKVSIDNEIAAIEAAARVGNDFVCRMLIDEYRRRRMAA